MNPQLVIIAKIVITKIPIKQLFRDRIFDILHGLRDNTDIYTNKRIFIQINRHTIKDLNSEECLRAVKMSPTPTVLSGNT
jgi:hypothetical protein